MHALVGLDPAATALTARHGRFFVQDDRYIGRSLKLYGEYSEGEIDLFRHFVRPESMVLDVGANIGALTIPLARLANRVIAIEPQPENRGLLRKNIAANCLESRVTIIRAAVGAAEGTTKIAELSELNHRNFGAVVIGEGKIPISVRTIDDIADGLHIDFMKIDIEGSERDALIGARETIRRCKPVIYVECDRPDKEGALKALLHEYGYVMYRHQPPLFNPKNFNEWPENDFGNTVSRNLLCLHRDYIGHLPDDENLDPIREPVPGLEIRKEGAPRNATNWAGIVRLGGIGDNLIAASVLAPLKRRGFQVEVIAADPQHVIFENNPWVDKLSVKLAPRDLPQNNMMAWQAWFQSRSHEYALFANLSHSLEYLLAFLPEQSAFQWSDDIRRKLANRNYLEMVHDIVGVPYEFGPLFFPTIEEKAKAQETKARIGKRCVAWCLSGTRIDKLYPLSAMAIARIIREIGVPVVMMGAPGKEFVMSKQIMEHVERQNGSLEGLHQAISPDPENPSWPLRRALSFVHACDLVIGPDTGPMWAAAFEPIPKIMLLSHASPENITKHWVNTITLHADQENVSCWPCHKLHNGPETCRPNKENLGAACISDISVEMLLAAVKTSLKTGETT